MRIRRTPTAIHLRLAAKIIGGGSTLDRLRLVLLAAAGCLCVLALILALRLPMVFDAHSVRESARTATSTDDQVDGTSTLRYAQSQETYEGKPLIRVVLGAAGTAAPRPPGVDALPLPGRTLVSPALADAMTRDPDLALRVTGTIDGVIADEGLVDPDELLAYVGVETPFGAVVDRFGSSMTAAPVTDGPSIALELLVLVAVPAGGLLVVASRLALGRREERLRVLRVLGLSALECSRLFAAELSCTALAGACAAVLIYEPMQRALGATGQLGISWFGVDASLSPVAQVGVVACATVVAYVGGHAVIRRQMVAPANQARAQKGDRRRRGLAYVVATAWLGSLAVMAWQLIALPRQSRTITGLLILTVYLGGVVLLAAGLFFGPRLTRWFASRLSGARGLPVWLTLGLKMSRHHPAGYAAVISAVGCLIFVIGVATGVVHGLRINALGTTETVLIDAPISDLDGDGRLRALLLLEDERLPGYVAVQALGRQDNAFGGRDAVIYVGECGTIAVVEGASPGDCGDESEGRLAERTQMAGPAADPVLEPGQMIDIALVDGSSAELRAPDASIRSDQLTGFYGMVLRAGSAPWLLDASSAVLHLRVTVDDYEYAMGKLASASPSIIPITQIKDPDALVLITRQQGVLTFGLLCGIVLTFCALVVAGLDQALDQRRSSAALRLLGVSQRHLRLSSMVQKMFPVILTVWYFSAVAWLTAQVLLYATNTADVVYRPIAVHVGAASLLAVVVSAVVGLVAVGRYRPSLSEVRQ